MLDDNMTNKSWTFNTKMTIKNQHLYCEYSLSVERTTTMTLYVIVIRINSDAH